MQKKLIGIFICMLLISTTLPTISGSIITIKDSNNVQNYDLVPGELIIKLDKDTTISSPSIEILNQKHKVSSTRSLIKTSENTILDNIYLLSVPTDSDILYIVNDYSSNPDVEYAEPNYLIGLCDIPNDEKFSNQWFLHNTGHSGGTNDADIDAPEAWDIETGNSNVIIAIIDTGVDYTHPDLVDNIWINEDEIPDNDIDDDDNGFIDDDKGWDFVGESIVFPKPDNNPLDDFGHGTHCAGLASAVTNNSVGIASLGWNCKIMSIRVGGGIGLVNLLATIEGIHYAVNNGADVISMSWGSWASSGLLEDAMSFIYQHGVIAVAGAGNNPLMDEFYPAMYDSVIGVAATDKFDRKAYFSTYGNWIDVSAPGVEIYSTLPTYYVTMNFHGYKMNYDYLEGTSMSTPIVAGLAGLLLSYNPNLTPDEVRSLIRDSTDWIKTNKYIGNGRVNAHKALLIASGVTVPPNKPVITGPTHGKYLLEYTYNVTNTDPDGDDLYYLFDWGDGRYSQWVGPFNSGATGSASHGWIQQGKYEVKVKARDSYGVESPWSDPLIVTMPRNRAINGFFQWFLEQFPILQKTLLLYLAK
jgi:subtilisin family serine protease